MEELANSISSIVSLGDGPGGEDAQSYPVEQKDPSLEVIQNLTEALYDLSEYIETGRATILIEGETDNYQIQYNPSQGTIVTEQTEGTEYEQENLYSGNTELVEALQDLEYGTISDVEGVFGTLEVIYKNEGYFDISTSYNLRKSNVESSIEDSTSMEVNSTVFFSLDRLVDDLNGQPPGSFRGEYLGDQSRCLFSVLNEDVARFSSTIGIASIESADNILSKMEDADPVWRSEVSDVATTALIEDIESYLPPNVFRLEAIGGQYDSQLDSVFYRHRILFSFLGISSNGRTMGNGEWKISIQGKQFVEGTLDFPGPDQVRVNSTNDIELSEELVTSVETLYEWVYGKGRSENRIDILRNVVTLYARSLADVITDAETIGSSANSNLRYYRRDSVDDFVDFRQEMIEGAIQTQRQFSELRSGLMSGLSRDLFRTFGFIIAISAGLVIRVNQVLGEGTIFLVSSIIVGAYTLITHRRIKGIEKQYTTQTKNHENFETFYSRFFDDNELREFGVVLDSKEPGLLDRCVLPEQGDDEMTRRFRRDLSMYYALLITMGVMAIVLLLAMLSGV